MSIFNPTICTNIHLDDYYNIFLILVTTLRRNILNKKYCISFGNFVSKINCHAPFTDAYKVHFQTLNQEHSCTDPQNSQIL